MTNTAFNLSIMNEYTYDIFCIKNITTVIDDALGTIILIHLFKNMRSEYKSISQVVRFKQVKLR